MTSKETCCYCRRHYQPISHFTKPSEDYNGKDVLYFVSCQEAEHVGSSLAEKAAKGEQRYTHVYPSGALTTMTFPPVVRITLASAKTKLWKVFVPIMKHVKERMNQILLNTKCTRTRQILLCGSLSKTTLTRKPLDLTIVTSLSRRSNS